MNLPAPVRIRVELVLKGVVREIGVARTDGAACAAAQRRDGRVRRRDGRVVLLWIFQHRLFCRSPFFETALWVRLARLGPLVRDLQELVAGIRKIGGEPYAGAQVEVAFPYGALLVGHLLGEVGPAALELHRHHAGVDVETAVGKRGVREVKRVGGVVRAEGDGRIGGEEHRELAVESPAGSVGFVLVQKRICDEGVDAPALERLGEAVALDCPADDELDLALRRLACVGRERTAVPAGQLAFRPLDAERRRAGEPRFYAADHRRALGRRHGERNRHAVCVEVVGESRHAETAQPIVPDLRLRARSHLGLVKRRRARKRQRAALLQIRHLVRLVAAVREVVGLYLGVPACGRDRLLAAWEPAVCHKGHRGVGLELGHALRRIEAASPGLEKLRERALHLADGALVAKREVEVGERDEGHLRRGVEAYLEGVVVDVAELLHERIPRVCAGRCRSVARRLEEVCGGYAAVRGGRARVVGDKPVHVEKVGDVNCAVREAPGIVAERPPYGGRSLPGPVAHFVHERRRKIGEALERKRRRGLGDVLLAPAPEEHAVAPGVLGPAADSRMDAVRNGPVDLVDRAGQGGLRKLARGDGAPQIARREARTAHVGRKRDGGDYEERKYAEHYEERRSVSLHLRSSSVSL